MRKRLLIFIVITLVLMSFMSFSFANEPVIKEPYVNSDYILLEPYIKVMAADNEYIWAAGGIKDEEIMKLLYRSSDYGESWELVHIFEKKIEAIHIAPNGYIFISISNDRWSREAKGEIWRFSDTELEFIKVLDVESGAAYTWNIASDDEGYVFVSEYGYKGEIDNARRIYRSKDSGDNWEIVYEPEEILGYHNHVIHIDEEDNNIIYQVVGDDVKTILRSEDRGDTWESIVDGYHPTSIIQIDNEILFGLDNYPNSGIIRYSKETGEVSDSLITPKPFSGSIYDMIYVNDIIYAGLLSYDYNNWDGSIFISRDKGHTWENFLVWPKDSRIGVGFYKFSVMDDYLFVWVTLPVEIDGIIEKYQGTLRIKLIQDNAITETP